MSDHLDKSNEQKDQDKVENSSRRRFTQASMATPVLFSIASKPVWGNVCSISGMQSGTHSGQAEIVCEGCTYEFWLSNPDKWPAPYSPGVCITAEQLVNGVVVPGVVDGLGCNYDGSGTVFQIVFGDTDFEGMDFMQILQVASDPTGRLLGNYVLAANAIAALLNAARLGYRFGHTPQDIISMYRARYAIDAEGLLADLEQLNSGSCPL